MKEFLSHKIYLFKSGIFWTIQCVELEHVKPQTEDKEVKEILNLIFD